MTLKKELKQFAESFKARHPDLLWITTANDKLAMKRRGDKEWSHAVLINEMAFGNDEKAMEIGLREYIKKMRAKIQEDFNKEVLEALYYLLIEDED